MFGSLPRPTASKPASSDSSQALVLQLEEGPSGRWLRSLGTLARGQGKRLLLFGSHLSALAFGKDVRGLAVDLAVSGDCLGFVRDVAQRLRARACPRVEGSAVARIQAAGQELRFHSLDQGIFSFLASRDFSFEALGLDLSEPAGLIDAWGGLQDAKRRLLSPLPKTDLRQPRFLLKALRTELSLGLEPSPRLLVQYPRLMVPEILSSLPAFLFWEEIDPFLVPGQSAAFQDGRLSGVLDAFFESRGVFLLERRQDLDLIEAMDEIEGRLKAGQIPEAGRLGGAGLSSAARLLGLIALRQFGPHWQQLDPAREGKLHQSCYQIGRPAALARVLVSIHRRAKELAQAQFPREVPQGIPRDALTGAAGLWILGLREVARRRGDVALFPLDGVRALKRLLGPRVPRAA